MVQVIIARDVCIFFSDIFLQYVKGQVLSHELNVICAESGSSLWFYMRGVEK